MCLVLERGGGITHRSLWRDGLNVASILYLGWVWLFLLHSGTHVDVVAYWHAAQGSPYAISQAGSENAFLYSPVVAQLLALVARVPLPWIIGGLLAISLGGLVYLVGPWIAAVTLLTPLPFVWQDLSSGNIHILLAVAIVAGFRYPASWSFVLLTKVTPGVGLIWFAVRKEGRALGLALAVTAVIALASFAAAPTLWAQWFDVLVTNNGTAPSGLFVPGPLWVRLCVAIGVVAWGAHTNRPWTVPVAAMTALPVIWIYDGFAMLLGAVSLLRRQAGAMRHER
jgi:hypothetical protein